MADKALYVAKTGGRNQVRWNDQPQPAPIEPPDGTKKESDPCREASSEVAAVVE
jgi:hypothetical protein